MTILTYYLNTLKTLVRFVPPMLLSRSRPTRFCTPVRLSARPSVFLVFFVRKRKDIENQNRRKCSPGQVLPVCQFSGQKVKKWSKLAQL